jgi:pantoate--beta-alanine ligase
MRRQVERWRASGLRIGFVPTMGALHEGHLSLVGAARRRVGSRGRVVLSVYVNPTQFAPHEDLANYPRDLRRDCQLCRAAGVDVVFAPNDAQLYPGQGASAAAASSTWVVEERLSRGLEGASRPTHFRGVTTVVTKLFNIVQPHVAVFGAKDFQQAAVVRRMTRDLCFPVAVVVAPTMRAPDGLALSSRNAYLSREERAQAVVLWEAIRLARAMVRRAARPIPVARLRERLRRLLAAQPAARPDYIEFFDGGTLEPVRQVRRGTHLALAVRVGRTRLIDNARL